MIRVKLLDHMGSDLSVCQAARGCYGKETDVVDPRLINHLATSAHWNPFSHQYVSFKVSAPLFVRNQLMRHRRGVRATDDLDILDVTTITEVSRRYHKSDHEFYQMDYRVKNKSWEGEVEGVLGEVYASVDKWITTATAAGIPHEQLRAELPQTLITTWVWTGALAAWARVGVLRLDMAAQKETREVAAKISKEMEVLFPVSWAALVLNHKEERT